MTPDPSVPRRVQIVPLGVEYARLRVPIMEWRADVVVAVEYAESEGEIPYLDDLLAELRANDRIELDVLECDIFDLYAALGTIAGAIEEYAGDEVYVNLSSGSKITAIAGMLACMATGARPIYARPDYGPDAERLPEEPLHDEVAEVFELPTYPIERPSRMHVVVLDFVRESAASAGATGRYRGASKSDLIDFALDREFAFVVESEATTRKGLYRLLDTHVVRPLLEKGYVSVEKVGRRKFVALTSEGENALRAFRYLL